MTYAYPIPKSAARNRPDQTYHVAGASDLLAPIGTPVFSITDGTVIGAGWDSVGGNYVLMRGLDGLSYYFAHFRDAPLVAAGQSLAAGQQIGVVGKTGNASSLPDSQSHVHIGIGYGIVEGSGPAGGAGAAYDAQAFLERLYDGAVGAIGGAFGTPSGLGGAVDAVSGGLPTYRGQSPADWIRQVAGYFGIDPATALQVAGSEGGTAIWDKVGDNGQSHGPFQLYYGGGLGNEFTAATGIKPGDPNFGPMSVVFALQYAALHGWYDPNGENGFHGARRLGLDPWKGITSKARAVALGLNIGGVDIGGIVGGIIGGAVAAPFGGAAAGSVFGTISGLFARALGVDPSNAVPTIGLDLVLLIIALLLIGAGVVGIAMSSNTVKQTIQTAKSAAEVAAL